MKIEEIREKISTQIGWYEASYNGLTRRPLKLLAEVNQQITLKKGKELRPILTILSAMAFGMSDNCKESSPLFKIAALVEILHNATLIHDDVIDESDIRRGSPTLNHNEGNQIAVIAGDYFLATVMQCVNEIDNPAITKMINSCIEEMTLGEMIQHYHRGDYEMSEAVYQEIIQKKTATFIATCCSGGAVLATSQRKAREAARRFGMEYGMAFQMRDDLLDLQSSAVTGKPSGNDIKEKKVTLPIILTLNRLKTAEREHFLGMLRCEEMSELMIDEIVQKVSQSGAIEETFQRIENRANRAKEALHDSHTKDTPYKEMLLDMVSQLTVREF